jgi:hypothetical protein
LKTACGSSSTWFESTPDPGFLPTMHKPRRASSKYWLGELRRLAARNDTQVFAPINDMASIADKALTGHPYAAVATEVLRAIGD